MIKIGVVVATDGKLATIEELSSDSCIECLNKELQINCLKCKKRSQDNVERHIALTAYDAAIGDVVEYSKNNMANFFSTVLTLFLPMLLTFVSYIAVKWLTSDDQASIRVALTILTLSMICAGLYSYIFNKRRCDYKIISKF